MERLSCASFECGMYFRSLVPLSLLISALLRPGTQEFIAQQMQILTQMQAEQEHRAQQIAKRKTQRPRESQQELAIPAVPAIPE
jgi:hypothetical protein